MLLELENLRNSMNLDLHKLEDLSTSYETTLHFRILQQTLNHQGPHKIV